MTNYVINTSNTNLLTRYRSLEELKYKLTTLTTKGYKLKLVEAAINKCRPISTYVEYHLPCSAFHHAFTQHVQHECPHLLKIAFQDTWDEQK